MNAIIFDVDGTLWDSCQAVANAWNTVFNRYKELNGKTVTAEVAKSFMGKTSEEIFSTLLPDLKRQKMLSIMEELMLDIMFEVPKDPGIGTVVITRGYLEKNGGPRIEMRG